MQTRQTKNGIQYVVYKSEALDKVIAEDAKKSHSSFSVSKLRKIPILMALLAVGLIGYRFLYTKKSPLPARSVVEIKSATTSATQAEPDMSLVASVVNKKHPLPPSYVPKELVGVEGQMLRTEAAAAYSEMAVFARNEGYIVRLLSGYRSFDQQTWTYNDFVKNQGKEKADTFSARPGYSEHQTGLAVDIGGKNESCDTDICFKSTPLGLWLIENAQTYGFIIRYPEGRESATGYQYEPWHLRYVGKDVATKVYAAGQTLDEYLNISAGSY